MCHTVNKLMPSWGKAHHNLLPKTDTPTKCHKKCVKYFIAFAFFSCNESIAHDILKSNIKSCICSDTHYSVFLTDKLYKKKYWNIEDCNSSLFYSAIIYTDITLHISIVFVYNIEIMTYSCFDLNWTMWQHRYQDTHIELKLKLKKRFGFSPNLHNISH